MGKFSLLLDRPSAVSSALCDFVCTSFYYDFYVPGEQLTPDDLKKIKKEMEKIIKSNLPITREEVSRDEAL